jgi:hypothetical protein
MLNLSSISSFYRHLVSGDEREVQSPQGRMIWFARLLRGINGRHDFEQTTNAQCASCSFERGNEILIVRRTSEFPSDLTNRIILVVAPVYPRMLKSVTQSSDQLLISKAR